MKSGYYTYVDAHILLLLFQFICRALDRRRTYNWQLKGTNSWEKNQLIPNSPTQWFKSSYFKWLESANTMGIGRNWQTL